MKVELPLAEMTVAEKLQTMEALWTDLTKNSPDDAVPWWHADVLAERERRLASGQEAVIDWEEAKRRLRREINERKNP
jgi:hypothetical protein